METVSHIDANQNAQAADAPLSLPCAITEGSEPQMIPLKRLVKSPYNQRKKPRTGIESLADNIAAIGLLQNLVVHAMKASPKKALTYGVAAGETRRQALDVLVSRGTINADYLVPCKVVPLAEAILVSAAENDMREPPHPADQCDAYRALVESGRSAEFIAAMFGVHPKTVARRLKLANVAPKLMDLFRNDEITLEQVQALALTDDHEAQERVWFAAQDNWHRQPGQLRAVLTREEIDAEDDDLAKFVGLAAFEQAGGKVRRDLFADDGQGWYTDTELMTRLALDKLAPLAETVRTEGWKWVEVRVDFPHDEQSQFSRIHPGPFRLSDEQVAEINVIETRQGEIEAKQESEDTPDDEYDRLEQELEGLQSRYAEIQSAARDYEASEKPFAGAVVCLGYSGRLSVFRGLVRADEEEALRDTMQANGNGAQAAHLTRSAPAPKQERGVHSEKLLLRLTARRTAAVQSELAMNPHVALAAMVHQLAVKFLLDGYSSHAASALQISGTDCTYKLKTSAPELIKEESFNGLRQHAKAWRMLFPQNKNELFGWLLDQSDERLMQVLAVCTSLSIDGVTGNEQSHAINALAGALNMNLSAYWQPTRESYLDHVSKDRIVAIIGDVVSPDEGKRLAKMKKGEAATAAETLLKGKNWLPEFMAAAEVNEAFFGDDEDDEDEDVEASGSDDDADTADEAEAAPVSDEQAVHANADRAPWPFPKAADFVAEASTTAPLAVNVARSPCTALATLSPAAAWPFPPSKLAALRSTQHAA